MKTTVKETTQFPSNTFPKFRKIALLYGGNGAEKKISRLSAENLLFQYEKYSPKNPQNSKKYQLIPVEVNEQGFFLEGNSKKNLDANYLSSKFDGAFLIVHGSPIEDGKLQGYLEWVQLPYVGSNTMASALTFNKYACSSVVSRLGIDVPQALLVRKENSNPKNLNLISWKEFPCFVKPNQSGSSFATDIISDFSHLCQFLKQGFEQFDEFLVESYIRGREITCGIYQTKNQCILLPPTEIKTKNSFFDYRAKYEGESEEITPADISPELTTTIQTITKKIFLELGCSGFARADYIVTDPKKGKEKIYFIEINTIPGFSKKSLVPQQLMAAGIEIGFFIESLLDEIS